MRMPKTKEQFTDLEFSHGPGGREDLQHGWHSFVGGYCKERTILDVGAGLGLSRDRLIGGGNNNRVTLQDVGPDLPVDITTPVEEIETDSYDVVASFDVIEHVREDWSWLANLTRIARDFVFITTPNYNVSEAQNPCHVREYTPQQLRWMCGKLASVWGLYAGNPEGTVLSQNLKLSPNIFDASLEPHLAVILYTGGRKDD